MCVGPIGEHMLKAYTRKRNIIARSSAEAELHAAAQGPSESKGIAAMMCDFGFLVKLVLVIDAQVTEHILHRHGSVRMKHIDLANLCLQDEVRSNRLVVRRVSSEQNVSNLCTEALSRAVIASHAETLGQINMSSSH